MVETYTEIAAEFDVATDNEKFNEYMDATAAGFGLTPLSQALAEALAQPAPPAAPQTQQVSGQKLEEQAKAEPIETDYTALYWLALIFLIGAAREWFQRPLKPSKITSTAKVELKQAA